MKTQTLNAETLQAAIVAALNVKIQQHIEKDGIEPQDVKKSIKKVSVHVAQFLIDCERENFAQWCESAPVKSIMRACNLLDGITSKDETLGRDLIAQSLILTARAMNTDTLPLELVKFQVIKGRECEDISTMTKGKNIMKAARKMSPKTALSMISNRCGKNGYMQFLGMVSRSDDKSVIIDKGNPIYKAAAKLLKGNKEETVAAQ